VLGVEFHNDCHKPLLSSYPVVCECSPSAEVGLMRLAN